MIIGSSSPLVTFNVTVAVVLCCPAVSVATVARVSAPAGALAGTVTSKKALAGVDGGVIILVSDWETAPLAAPVIEVTATSSIA